MGLLNGDIWNDCWEIVLTVALRARVDREVGTAAGVFVEMVPFRTFKTAIPKSKLRSWTAHSLVWVINLKARLRILTSKIKVHPSGLMSLRSKYLP